MCSFLYLNSFSIPLCQPISSDQCCIWTCVWSRNGCLVVYRGQATQRQCGCDGRVCLTLLFCPLLLACIIWASQWASHVSGLLGPLKRSWRSGLWMNFQTEQPVLLGFVPEFLSVSIWRPCYSSREILTALLEQHGDFYEVEIYRTSNIFKM